MQPDVSEQLGELMADPDSGVRYWGAMGALIRGADEVRALHDELTGALEDPSPSVRVAAAEALGTHGTEKDLQSALDVLIKHADSVANGSYVAIHALNAISALGDKAAPLKEQIAGLPALDPDSPSRVNREYATNLINRLRETL